RREFGIWRRLNHPNIVPFLGIITGFNTTSLVSVWMRNGTLERFLEKYVNIEIDHRLRLVRALPSHITALHTSVPDPIVHGDLNPVCNQRTSISQLNPSQAIVLLDDDYTAHLLVSMEQKIPQVLIYLEDAGVRSGNIRWNAPELFSSSVSDERTTESDVYSFGCIALQASLSDIAFRPWSEIRGDVALISRLSQGQAPGRPRSRPIDDQHWELVEQCLSQMPQDRPTANTVVSSIEQFLERFPHSQPLRDVITRCQSGILHSLTQTTLSPLSP
ncbi:kinase-like domain-containing protein, partial [Boletus edulis]